MRKDGQEYMICKNAGVTLLGVTKALSHKGELFRLRADSPASKQGRSTVAVVVRVCGGLCGVELGVECENGCDCACGWVGWWWGRGWAGIGMGREDA